MSLASDYQKQVSALPAPPLLQDSSDGEIRPNFFLLTPDTAELGTENQSQITDDSQLLGSDDYFYYDSYDDAPAAPGAGSTPKGGENFSSPQCTRPGLPPQPCASVPICARVFNKVPQMGFHNDKDV